MDVRKEFFHGYSYEISDSDQLNLLFDGDLGDTPHSKSSLLLAMDSTDLIR